MEKLRKKEKYYIREFFRDFAKIIISIFSVKLYP